MFSIRFSAPAVRAGTEFAFPCDTDKFLPFATLKVRGQAGSDGGSRALLHLTFPPRTH